MQTGKTRRGRLYTVCGDGIGAQSASITLLPPPPPAGLLERGADAVRRLQRRVHDASAQQQSQQRRVRRVLFSLTPESGEYIVWVVLREATAEAAACWVLADAGFSLLHAGEWFDFDVGVHVRAHRVPYAKYVRWASGGGSLVPDVVQQLLPQSMTAIGTATKRSGLRIQVQQSAEDVERALQTMPPLFDIGHDMRGGMWRRAALELYTPLV